MSESAPTAERERFTGYMAEFLKQQRKIGPDLTAAAIRATCPKCNGVIRQDQTVRDVQAGKVNR